MAEVTRPATPAWTSAQTRAQFAAITRLRMRIFRNGLRRKGGVGDLIANLIMIPIFAVIILGPSVAAGGAAWYFVSKNELPYIGAVLWVIFVLCQFTSIQLGQPGTTFDPTQLIRFPLNFRGYATIRTFFGLISPSNVVGALASLSVAIGITVAEPGLWAYAFLTLFAFAVANTFFTRMLFSWVDRWLSTRRAREVFTGLIFVFSMGMQYINFAFNPGLQHGHHQHNAAAQRISTMQHLYDQAHPVLTLLPPGLAVNALTGARLGHLGLFAASVFGIFVFAAIFFTIFAMRLYKEFRGENLSDAANAVAKPTARRPTHRAAPLQTSVPTPAAASSLRFSTPPTISAVFGKEFLTLRRNSGIFYAIVAPLVMVIFFVTKFSMHSSAAIIFPASVAYTMLGIAPLSFNSLGLEAAGIQFYFLAPVKMRDVFIAKNLMNLALAAIEIICVYITILVASKPPSFPITISVLLWAAFSMLLSLAVGNRRSITAPKKLDPAKLSGKQASPLSALLSMGILLLTAGIGAGLLLLSQYLEQPWVLPPSMLVLAAISFFLYRASLNSTDKLLADYRDTLSEVLCKAG